MANEFLSSLADEDGLDEQPNPIFLLPMPIQPGDNSSALHCSARLLQLSFWLISVLDLVLALLAIPFNALLVPSAFFARPIPLRIRRSLSAICLSYALLAGILLAKKCFWLYTALDGAHCVPALSSVACKLQEFPVVFIYLHTLALALAFAIQMALGRWWRGAAGRRGGEKPSSNNALFLPHPWPKEARLEESHCSSSLAKPGPRAASTALLCPMLCSSQQILLVVTCLGMALLFTAFDQEPAGRPKVLVNCSIPLAIRQKGLVFALLSLVLLSQLLQTLLWHFIPAPVPKASAGNGQKKGRGARPSLMSYLVLACRDLFLAESIAWTLVALLTGLSMVQQFVLLRPCTKCTRLAIELCFSSLPLLISLAHPLLCLLLIAPVRFSAQRFCPVLNRLFPTQEPVTPPLPRHFPNVRILVTEH